VKSTERNHTGHRVGEGHQRATASDALVREARRLHEAGNGYRTIGRILNIPWRTVADWCRYETRWSA
jgi:hypothetical protein